MVPQGRREVTVRHLEQLQFRVRDRLPAALAERSSRSWVRGWQVVVQERWLDGAGSEQGRRGRDTATLCSFHLPGLLLGGRFLAQQMRRGATCRGRVSGGALSPASCEYTAPSCKTAAAASRNHPVSPLSGTEQSSEGITGGQERPPPHATHPSCEGAGPVSAQVATTDWAT